MSRQVDLTKPLSDEDRQYLIERADNRSLEINAAHVAGAEASNPVDTSSNDQGGDPADLAVEDMTVQQLHDAIVAHNEQHGTDLAVSGNKEELQMRLTEARAAQDSQ